MRRDDKDTVETPKFTPGEWVAVKADLNGDDENRWSVCVNANGGRQWFLATIENGALGDTLDTEEGNARLFAASKDLLTALQLIMRDLPTRRDWLDPVVEQMARAAITKAIGEQS